jgi:Asp/Glu/hydantoin racemase
VIQKFNAIEEGVTMEMSSYQESRNASGGAATIKLMLSNPTPGKAPKSSGGWYQKTVEAVARPGTTIDVVDLKRGYTDPTTPYTAAYNAIGMVERAYEAEKKGYDAFVIGCAFDPGLRESRALLSIPVVAPTESAALLASTLGNKFSIIAIDPSWCPVIERIVQSYGLGDKLASVSCPPGLTMPTAFGMMFGGEQEKLVELMTKEMTKVMKENGAEVFTVGCTVAATVLTMRGVHEVDGAPVLDLIAAEIKMAETMVDLKRAYGIGVCKASIYYPPRSGWEQEIPILVD